MEAVVSGRAGVALLWEGDALFSLHLGMAPDDALPRREWEIPHLLGEANDLRRLNGADRARVASELEHDAKCIDALHLVLITLDPELPEDLRMDAAAEFEELFGEDSRFAEFVENVLFSSPLPKDGDLAGALQAARGTVQPLQVLTDFERHQNQIADAWVAWQGIPDDLFARPEDRQRALNSAVKSGCFRRLVRRLAQGERVDLFLVEALTNPEVRAVPNHREIWIQWVRPLREESRYSEQRSKALEVAEPAPDFGLDDRRVSIDRGGAFDKAQRRKAAIVELLTQGDVGRAREYVEDLISSHAESGGSEYSAKSLCDLAIQARDLGFEDLHLEWSHRATLERPEDGWAWAQYGNALAEEDRSTEAEQAFRNAVGFGQPSIGNSGLADLRKRQGDLEGALEGYDAVLAEDSSDGVAANGRADVLRLLGHLGEALTSYEMVITEFPRDVYARTGKSEVLRELGRLEEALTSYEAVIAEFPRNVYARSGKSEVLRELGRLEEALTSYESVIAEFPRNVVARSGKSEVLRELGRLEEALTSYESVIAEFPRDVVARNGKSEVLRELGRLEEALASYESVIAEFPRNVVARSGKSEVLRELGRLDEALASYESVIVEFPRDVYARSGKSEVLRELGRLDEALTSYESVIAEFPRNVVARSGKSEVLRELGRLEEALASYESVIAEFPRNLVARNGRAQVLSLLGRWEEALATLPAAPPTLPEDWIGYHIRGMVVARQERLDEARDIFSAGVRANLPPRHDAYFRSALAAIELRRRQFREAAETLAPVEDGRMALPACMLLLHALGAMGRQAQVAEVAESLAAIDLPEGPAELLAELQRRFIQQLPAGRSEEWIWAQELDMLTTVTRIARGFELALLLALRSYRTPPRQSNRP